MPLLLKQDYFHATINWTSYEDKPLLTYWFILAVNFIVRALGEWTLRAPSAVV